MSQVIRDLQKLRDLERISGFVLQRELAELERISRKQNEAVKEIARLQKMASTRAKALLNDGSEDPAFLAGRDQAWHRWVEERIASLNNRLARLRASQEMQKERASRAFGRAEAIKRLMEKNL